MAAKLAAFKAVDPSRYIVYVGFILILIGFTTESVNRRACGRVRAAVRGIPHTVSIVIRPHGPGNRPKVMGQANREASSLRVVRHIRLVVILIAEIAHT